MNAKLTFVLFLVFTLVLAGIISAEVPIAEKEALVALYNSTDGTNWTNNTNWLTSAPVSEWYGVIVSYPGDVVTSLNLSENNLSGLIPPEIGNMQNLITLRLDRNQLTGSIPPEIGTLINLRNLYIYSNPLQGSIPPEIGNLTILEGLYLSYNQLTGSIPPEIGMLTKLRESNLNNNQLTGSIPPEIGMLTNLRSLSLDDNQLTGSIPPEIGMLTNLRKLWLSNNQFTGIPPEIGMLTNLTFVYLNNNQLTGSIPPEIGLLTNMESIFLEDNQLTGSIPPEIGMMTNLYNLYLQNNQLTGSIPPEISLITNLRTLWLSNNQFTDLPCLSALASLNSLKIENNKFTFEDIEPNIGVPYRFYYSPQDNVGEQQDITVNVGESLTVSVSVGGDNNQYQWKKDGIIISGALSSSYTINSVNLTDTGSYICEITNTVAKDLTLYSRPINVTVTQVQSSITLTAPNGSESWEASTTQNIIWASENVDNVKLEYSTNGGDNWTTIEDSIPSSGSYAWLVPIRPSVNYLVRVLDVTNLSVNDMSDAVFTVQETSGNTMLFVSNRDGNNEIYVMNPDGSNQTNLTNNSAIDEYPTWSPDGSKIVFNSNRDGNREIYIMDSDGSNPTRLTNNSSTDMEPTWSPDGSKIAFISDRDGNTMIYVMNTDGSNQTRLTTSSASDDRPFWSPDGSKIAFSSNRDGNHAVFVMNSDGSNQTNLTNNSNADAHPSWSPDGSKIAFYSDRDGNGEIYLMNTDGSSQTRLTNNTYNDYRPTWSPDGSKIAFHSNRVGNNEVYVMNADGSSQTRLTNNSATDYFPSWARPVYHEMPGAVTLTAPNGAESWEASTTQNIIWSSTDVDNVKLEYSTNGGENWTTIEESIPSTGSYAWLVPIRPSVNCLVRVLDVKNLSVNDVSDAVFTIQETTGNTILFHSNRSGNNEINEIYVMNPDGSNQTQLTFGSSSNSFGRWSPDGSKIVYQSYIDGNSVIYTMNSDGSNQTRLTNNSGYDSLPSWSPDGSKVAFSSTFGGSDNAIFVINTDGSNQVQLTGTNCMGPHWSPDGSKIVYFSGSGSNEDIFIMNADGSNQTAITSTNNNNYPSWSPNGSKIVFSSTRDGNDEIYVMDVDGSNQTRLTNNSGNDILSSFSPDNSKIAFRSSQDGNFDIYVMNVDGSNQIRLTNISAGDNAPSWARPVYVPKVVALTSPNGGESWEASTTQNITWTSENVTSIRLEYSTDNGGNWTEIVTSTDAMAGSYSWLVPIRPSANCMVRISDASDASVNDVSNAVFTIAKGVQELIAFHSNRDGNIEIYVMNSDGSNQTRLTNNSSIDYRPSFSPDGSRILFYTNRDNGNYDIYVMDADGSNPIRLTTHSAMDEFPRWSPDGSSIVFTSGRDGNYEIYTMNADGSNKTNVTNHPGADMRPSWSPDGSGISFETSRDGNFEIYSMNSDGSNQTRLTNISSDDVRPTWSPDGSKIAFNSFRDGNFEIYVMNFDGSNQTNLSNNSAADEYVTWSADGTQLAFSSNRDSNNEVYIINSDGTNQTRITNNSAADNCPSYAKTTSVFVTSPQGGESWTAGTTETITWVHNGVSDVNIEYSTDGGSIWDEIVPSTPASNTTSTAGSYEWIVEETASTNCLVRITDVADASVTDISNAMFTIESAATVALTAPNGGEEYIIGTDVEITWDVENVTNDLVIELSTDNGDTWTVIGEEIVPASGTYLWTVPEVESSDCLIRITDSVIAEVTDSSDAPFRIKSLETVLTELIEDILADGDISGGTENSLTNKLENALSNLDKENDSANNILEALINQIEALRGKKLTDEQADELIASVQVIIAINSGLAKPAIPQKLPESFGLSQNRPNPFNPTTTIEYSIPDGKSQYVTLTIYDTRGSVVRKLVDNRQSPGNHSIQWDSTDSKGNSVSSGIYIYHLRAGDFIQTKKMLFVK